MRISDWSSDVCSSDLVGDALRREHMGASFDLEYRIQSWIVLRQPFGRNQRDDNPALAGLEQAGLQNRQVGETRFRHSRVAVDVELRHDGSDFAEFVETDPWRAL